MNDMFLDDIKKDVSVTTYTDTSTSAIHTYPDDAIITDIINCVNTAFPDTSRQHGSLTVEYQEKYLHVPVFDSFKK